MKTTKAIYFRNSKQYIYIFLFLREQRNDLSWPGPDPEWPGEEEKKETFCFNRPYDTEEGKEKYDDK